MPRVKFWKSQSVAAASHGKELRMLSSSSGAIVGMQYSRKSPIIDAARFNLLV
jgi:hypothetical protein